tara:strand:- start:184738 stop:186015 length:1278 start_codon:yes stop_codon:yes gene_type:complete
MKKITLLLCTILVLPFALTAQQNTEGGCITPTITDASGPAEICSGETATLTATSDGEEIYWFDEEIDGNIVGIGSPFETDPLTQTSFFWAEARNFELGTLETGGAHVAPTSTSTATVNPTTAPWGLVFDADQGFILNTVDVYLASPNPGTLTVQLKDSDFNIVEETTVATPPGSSGSPVQFEVTLDFEIPMGTGWRLVASESPSMIREFSSGHPGFPYPIGAVGSVTQGTINDSNTSNSGLYYFFYNWSYTPFTFCASNREEVVVTVNETALPDGEGTQGFDAGQTLADLVVTGENLTWYEDAGGMTEIPDTTPLVDGTTYYVSQTIDGCESGLLAIIVQENLSTADVVFAGLTFYPNPVVDNLHLTNTRIIESAEVYSLSGQKVLTQEINSLTASMNLGQLKTGVYFINISSEGISKTIKVMKK